MQTLFIGSRRWYSPDFIYLFFLKDTATENESHLIFLFKIESGRSPASSSSNLLFLATVQLIVQIFKALPIQILRQRLTTQKFVPVRLFLP